MWQVIVLAEVEEWIDSLDSRGKNAVLAGLTDLSIHGPNLGRPLVDRIHGSLLTNLKELRPIGGGGKTSYRLLFIFDKNRSALILVGGDKFGLWRDWYQRNIDLAEFRYLKYLEGEK
ncbi:MAG: hypothetical protein RL174_981 [Actinomycetota bacterium]|jgi:hypothetical protein